jgi:hypothetical protein
LKKKERKGRKERRRKGERDKERVEGTIGNKMEEERKKETKRGRGNRNEKGIL